MPDLQRTPHSRRWFHDWPGCHARVLDDAADPEDLANPTHWRYSAGPPARRSSSTVTRSLSTLNTLRHR